MFGMPISLLVLKLGSDTTCNVPKNKNKIKLLGYLNTTYYGHYLNLWNVSYSIVILSCRNLFLLPTSLLSIIIITMFIVFTYNVVMLITM